MNTFQWKGNVIDYSFPPPPEPDPRACTKSAEEAAFSEAVRNGDLFTTQEAGEFLRASVSSVRKWVQEGKLKPLPRIAHTHYFLGTVLRAARKAGLRGAGRKQARRSRGTTTHKEEATQ